MEGDGASDMIELRDHRGRLVEARNERGQLVYAQRSNYARMCELREGRAARGRLRGRWHAYVTGRIWNEPAEMFAGHVSGMARPDAPFGDLEPTIAAADRSPRRRKTAA